AWTAAQLKTLRQRFPHEPTAVVARALGMTQTKVSQKAAKLGLYKTKHYMATTAKEISRQHALTNPQMITGRFKKGLTPANKGVRRPGWAPGRMAETQFKKGEMHGAAQHNYVPIGTEKIDGYGYLVRKVTDDPALVPARRWVGVHRLLWEEHLGPVPPGCRVVFKNGDKTDIRIDNLALVTAAEMMRRNTLHNYPKEIADAIHGRAVLNRAINRYLKEKQQ
ncbi:MAG: HNH endonuclease signature motif containing protein, partial [Pseudoxanthomonas sp.]